jgi:general secretion pathway protein E/type IV pilus assembly protein PilB
MPEELPITVNQTLLPVLHAEQAWHYRIIPKERTAQTLHFYIDEQAWAPGLQDELYLLLGQEVQLDKRPATDIRALLTTCYPLAQHDSRLQNRYYTGSADHFLHDLIAESKNLHSSDIHIEVYEEKCRVRIRIDGLLVQRYLVERSQYPSLINKIKILANLDIAEKRLPQDGRIFFAYQEQKFDIRVSVLPTLHGEKIVLRLLNNDATNIDLHTLGFSTQDLENYMDGIKKPNGLLLISGPTGSGKTTTLYATLKLLNKDTRNLVTIEDPIEYTLDGVNQVQLKESIGLTFGAALRTFLRQDPNIIMVGEIRDPDTANMAIRTALTGHLVLSTIHTNSAWGTVSRLIDMGIPPFLIADNLNTTVAQRLLRLLCPHCKTEQPFDEKLYPLRFKPYRRVARHCVPQGCDHCFNTGYKGRKAVYEVIPIDRDLAEQIKNANMNIKDRLKERQIKTLAENAFELFEQGHTSLDEIYALLTN